MKQGNDAAPSAASSRRGIRGTSSTRATGPRSPSARCRRTPTRGSGWCELDGVGQVIKELSPYEADLDWDAVTELDEIVPLVASSGGRPRRSTASRTRAPSTRWSTSRSRRRSPTVIGDRGEDVRADLAAFGADYGRLTREDHRRFVDAFRNGMIPGVEAD